MTHQQLSRHILKNSYRCNETETVTNAFKNDTSGYKGQVCTQIFIFMTNDEAIMNIITWSSSMFL
jgi:hypothetical protein